MQNNLSILALGVIAFALTGILTPAVAEQTFTPGVTISSAMGKWKQVIKEKAVSRIECQVERVSGDKETFVNFRFGDKGQTFPGGKRFYLTSTGPTTLTVQGNGITPSGLPLVINAYNGKVKIVSVTIHYL